METTGAKRALIAAGGNLSLNQEESPNLAQSPAETIGRVEDWLKEAGFTEISQSRVYRTPAFPAGSGPDYANAAFMATWDGSAEAALEALHGIEARAGRERITRWGARTLDLDLIALGKRISPNLQTWTEWANLSPEAQTTRSPSELILPHPRLQDRSFALVPLAELAPDWRHPVLERSMAEMLAARPAEERAEVVLWDHADK